MIATHNIKVNGRWIRPGEEYEPEEKAEVKPAEKPVKKVEEKPVVKETPKAEPVKETPKPKTPTRRKVSK